MAKATSTKNRPVEKSSEYVNDSPNTDEAESSSVEDQSSNRSRDRSSSSSESDVTQQSESTSESDESSPKSNSSKSSTGKRKRDSAEIPSRPRHKKLKTNTTNGSGVKATTIKPPLGYDTITLGASDFVAETDSMFKNLNGKQIWHITAPVSVPITSIATLDIQTALQGGSILHHQGANYSMSAAAASDSEAILLPSGPESVYSKDKVTVSKTFHLREMPQNKSAEDSVLKDTHGKGNPLNSKDYQFFAKKTEPAKSPRQQPLGLLMRYQPYGCTRTTSKPYQLLHPEDKRDEEIGHNLINGFQMPPGDDNADIHPVVKTPKKRKHGKTSGADQSYERDNVFRSDPMDIDTLDSASVLNTPVSKVKKHSKVQGSEKKKKKDRKEKT